MSHKSAWAFYLLGAFLTLGWKLLRYVRAEKKKGRAAHDAVAEWFLEDSAENTISWTTTIGFVWVFGTLYVELRAESGVFSFINVIPLQNSIAFFLGGLMELVAPQVAKQVCAWVLARLPGGGNNP